MIAPELLDPGYVALQLRFAAWSVENSPTPFVMAVVERTNLFRRFGFGDPAVAATTPDWQRFIAGLRDCASLDERVEWTVAFANVWAVPRIAPDDADATNPFSVEVVDGVIRTHFVPTVDEEISPLHPSRLEQRRADLRTVLERVVVEHPEVHTVRGGSWLYSTSGYRSLFPPTYIATAQVRTGTTRFQGSSAWGQFLDHRGALKQALADEFIARLEGLDRSTPWLAFPIPTLVVESPIEVFVEHFDLPTV